VSQVETEKVCEIVGNSSPRRSPARNLEYLDGDSV
jgi:hypothetical protein